MSTYKPSGPHIVHQDIDGQVIIVDLRAGTYFSLSQTASFAWETLVNGFSRDEMVEEVFSIFDGTPEEIGPSLDELLAQLVADQLIVKADATDTIKSRAINMAPSGDKQPFVKTTMQKHTEMKEFLVLDPIHDFEEAGRANVPTSTQVDSKTS